MKARLIYETPRGASVVRIGDAAELAPLLRRKGIGAQLVLDEGPRAGCTIGAVEECEGECERKRCDGRHWWHETGDDVGIPGDKGRECQR